jgi:hypothetical protein
MSNESSSFATLGCIVSGILSWLKWHSVGWAILHAICGWVYVIYYAIVYGIKF